MVEPPEPPNSVPFNWEEVEPREDADKIAVRVFGDSLAWLMSFCLSSPAPGTENRPRSAEGKTNLRASYRRFLALVYIYRPDLLDGRTIRSIATELEVNHQAFNKYVADVSLEFEQEGINQNSLGFRLQCRANQLRAAAEKNATRERRYLGKK